MFFLSPGTTPVVMLIKFHLTVDNPDGEHVASTGRAMRV